MKTAGFVIDPAGLTNVGGLETYKVDGKTYGIHGAAYTVKRPWQRGETEILQVGLDEGMAAEPPRTARPAIHRLSPGRHLPALALAWNRCEQASEQEPRHDRLSADPRPDRNPGAIEIEDRGVPL